jgi:hypothetical protein
MFIEFMGSEDSLVLVNPDKVLMVGQETDDQFAFLILDGSDVRVNVKQTFEEIKKRLGMSITPRAETIMLHR